MMLSQLTVRHPPPALGVVVEFYDQAHQALLLTSPGAPELTSASLPSIVEIPTSDFLAYYLFYKRGLGDPAYGSLAAIRSKTLHALAELDGAITFEGGSIHTLSAESSNRAIAERLGEAVGLSVVSALHGLTSADWHRIPESNKNKTLDFRHTSSNGKYHIKVECKGSLVANNQGKSPNVYGHKADIESKKVVDRGQPTSGTCVSYGTIVVIDPSTDHLAKCWLLDPPDEAEASPSRHRRLARIEFIANWLALFKPRSPLSAAIRTRLAALHALPSIEALDGVALVRGDGEPFRQDAFGVPGEHHPFYQGKTCIKDSPVGGELVVLGEGRFMFLGLREELIVLATKQSFEGIESYVAKPFVARKTLACCVPRARFRREFTRALPSTVEPETTGGYVRFEMEAMIYSTSAGLVLGFVDQQSRGSA